MQSANRIRTLWITPLSSRTRGAEGGAAETVMAGTARAAVVQGDGRKSARRPRGRSAPYATGTGRAIEWWEKSDETRGNRRVSRQWVARGRAS